LPRPVPLLEVGTFALLFSTTRTWIANPGLRLCRSVKSTELEHHRSPRSLWYSVHTYGSFFSVMSEDSFKVGCLHGLESLLVVLTCPGLSADLVPMLVS